MNDGIIDAFALFARAYGPIGGGFLHSDGGGPMYLPHPLPPTSGQAIGKEPHCIGGQLVQGPHCPLPPLPSVPQAQSLPTQELQLPPLPPPPPDPPPPGPPSPIVQ